MVSITLGSFFTTVNKFFKLFFEFVFNNSYVTGYDVNIVVGFFAKPLNFCMSGLGCVKVFV